MLDSCLDLLAWDEETAMPPAGVEYRSQQIAHLTGQRHAAAADPRFGQLLEVVEDSGLVADVDSAAAANVREWRRRYHRSMRLPRPLVEELAHVTTLAQQQWVQAKEESNFALLRPWLERIVALKRDEAQAVGIGDVDYDALLDEHEPGSRCSDISNLFETLRRELIPLVTTLTHSANQPDASILEGDFPVDRQRRLVWTVAEKIGFDFERGRLGDSAHPFFAFAGPNDIRIATRFHPKRFGEGFFAALHEIGHGLYEQGLDSEHYGTPAGEALSVAMHESQARFWEIVIGHGREFWRHFYPLFVRSFRSTFESVAIDDFHRAINRIESTPIRVTADGLTYNLHILIRFELEKALISDELRVADLPAAWNEAYRHHLGIVPANDAEGCLQDIHWPVGLFGYFPTYLQGNLIAAQLFDAAGNAMPNLKSQLAKGQFGDLLAWLSENVYRLGGRRTATQIVERATGRRLDHLPFITQMRQHYAEVYDGSRSSII